MTDVVIEMRLNAHASFEHCLLLFACVRVPYDYVVTIPLYFFLGPCSGVPIKLAAPRSLTPTTRSTFASNCWFGTARPDSMSAI